MTTQLTISPDWQQITDGTNQAVIQFYTLTELCDSPTKSQADTPCGQFNNTTLTKNPLRQIWVSMFTGAACSSAGTVIWADIGVLMSLYFRL